MGAVVSQKSIGMVDLPMLSSPTLKQALSGHYASTMTLEQLEKLSEQERRQHVLIVQDPFTSYYDAQVVADFVRLVEKLGFNPVLLPFSPNGKAQHIKGFLQRFAKTARKTADFLNRIALLAMPMVGVDPALVLCYRDEYKEIWAMHGVISRCNWFTSGYKRLWLISQSSKSVVSLGICLGIALKQRHYPAAVSIGPPFFHAMVQGLKMSALDAAVWPEHTAMRRRTLKIPWVSMRYHGNRHCKHCQVNAA